MTERQSDHAIDPLFLERWSPRAFDGSEVPDEDLAAMFDAKRGDADWERFLGLLIPWNQSWAHTASVLVYIISDSLPMTDRSTGEPAPSTTHSFDAGAAWVSLALQATRMGYHAHGMSGIQYDLARAELGLPDRYQLNAACVIGRIGDTAQLDEKMRSREHPSGRKPQEEFTFRGNFPG